MRTKYLLLVGLAALLGSCQNENEPKTSSVPGTEGDYRIIIEGDETDSPSRAGEKSFVGGTASGAGLYDGDRTATVSATPNSDYEIDYFWGGPASEPQKYNTTSTAATTYDVPIGGEDHTFHLKFKEKKREVTINAGTGGRVNPSGPADYKVMKAHNITATPNSGYEFTGWSVSGSGITLGNSSNASTTFTLASNYSSNGTITANFKQAIKGEISIDCVYEDYYGWSEGQTDVTYTVSSGVDIEATYEIEYYSSRDDGSSDSGIYWTTVFENKKYTLTHDYDDGYGNSESQSATLIDFVVKVNGQQIYKSANTPENGKIYNGYRIKYTSQNIRP